MIRRIAIIAAILLCRPATAEVVYEYALLTRGVSAEYASVKVPASLPVGTVLASKNLDPEQNTSPGDRNHLSIYVGNGYVIESQIEKGVIRTSLADYSKRPYAPVEPFYPRDPKVGKAAAAVAETFVGLPYRKISSMLPKDRNRECGMNCVSVVRAAYSAATGKRVKLHIPDDILEVPELTKERPKK